MQPNPPSVTPIAEYAWILDEAEKVEAAARVLYKRLLKEERDTDREYDIYSLKLRVAVGGCLNALKPLREFIVPNELGDFDRMPHIAYKKLAERLFAFAKTLKGILATKAKKDWKPRRTIGDFIFRPPVTREHLQFIGDVLVNGISSACEEVWWAIQDETEELFADFPTGSPTAQGLAERGFATDLEIFGEQHDASVKERERKRKEAEQAALVAKVASAIMELLPQMKPPADVDADEWHKALVGAASIFAGAVIAEKTIERISLAIIDKSKSTDEKLCAISKIAPIAPTLSADALGSILGKTAAAVKKTQWWIDNRKGEKTVKLAERKKHYTDKTVAVKGAKRDAKLDAKRDRKDRDE